MRPVPRARFLVTLSILVACAPQSSERSLLPPDPSDAGPDAPSPIDAPPIDAPPIDESDLAMICGGTAPTTYEEWERCYTKRVCEWQVHCQGMNMFSSVQECIAQGDDVEGGLRAAERRKRARAVAQGRASVDRDAFARCLMETSANYCDTAFFNVSCRTRFTGTLDDGDACYSELDCASPSNCVKTCQDSCCEGTCEAKPTAGQVCNPRVIDPCAPGLQCHFTGRNTPSICVVGDLDTSCIFDEDCDWGTWCEIPAGQQTGRCRASFGAGAACTNLLQCLGDTTCIGLTLSNDRPGRCQRISRPGDACDGWCIGNLYCDQRTCRPLPSRGESCSALTNCLGVNTICKNGICALRDGLGAACTVHPNNTLNHSCMPGLFCGTTDAVPTPHCEQPRSAGQPCSDPSHCESYLCSGTSENPGVCLSWSESCLATD